MTRSPRRLGMKIERTLITSREQWLDLRKADITASTISCLFGLNPYTSPSQLFYEKLGRLDAEVPDSTALRRGRLLESAVAEAFAEQHIGWKITKARHYYRDVNRRLGATPDYLVVTPDGQRAILQCKTVNPASFRKWWTDQSCPAWIMLQALTEAMLTKADFGLVAALVVDGYKFELVVYTVPRHEAAERRIQDAVAKFWDDAEHGKAPAIDYERDGALLAAMYPHHREGATIDLRADNAILGLLEEREKLKAGIATNEDKVKAIETEIRAKLTDNEIGLVNGWRLTLREQHRKEHMVKATSFRVLRAVREQQEEEAA